MIITQLSTFRGESAVTTWAYQVVVRYLLREKTRAGWPFETLAPVPVRRLIGTAHAAATLSAHVWTYRHWWTGINERPAKSARVRR